MNAEERFVIWNSLFNTHCQEHFGVNVINFVDFAITENQAEAVTKFS